MGYTWLLITAALIFLATRQSLAAENTDIQNKLFSDLLRTNKQIQQGHQPFQIHINESIDYRFEGKSDKEFLDELLTSDRYDKRLLPPVTDADFCCGLYSPKDEASVLVPSSKQRGGTLTVNVSVLLLSLASPDESSLKYEVEFLLQQQWYDPRLQYDLKSKYDHLNAIHHHNDIWLPDTYFIMHGDFKDPLIPVHFSLKIFRNGSVNYLMRRHLILSCQGSLNIFPFDDPLCSFAMESTLHIQRAPETIVVTFVYGALLNCIPLNIRQLFLGRLVYNISLLLCYFSYEQTAIKYVWKNDEDVLRKSPSLTTLNAYLIENQTIICPTKSSWRGRKSIGTSGGYFTCDLCHKRFEKQGNYSCLKVDLKFTRDRAFYFTTVFIPGIILVTSSFITFWLEWNAVPARVMIGVTTMLNFFTTSNGFRSTLPVVSNLTAMNVWDGVCMCFIYASLLEFVCVNYVGRKRPLHNVVYRPGENPVTQRLPAVLSRIGIILASPLDSIEQEFYSAYCGETPTFERAEADATFSDKKRDSTTVANEIVSCTTCGPNPCTHSANNGCAEVRKKEPPHPIRVAKTIDVIARITFPSAFAVFLIFFFYHYNSFTIVTGNDGN